MHQNLGPITSEAHQYEEEQDNAEMLELQRKALRRMQRARRKEQQDLRAMNGKRAEHSHH